MSEVSTSLTQWFSKRPQCLRIAAARLPRQSEPAEKDVSELAILSQREADGKLPESGDLLADMTSLKNRREEYTKRKRPASAVAG